MDGQIEKRIPNLPQAQIRTEPHVEVMGEDSIVSREEIEILNDSSQDLPFRANRRGNKWQLSVNRSYLETRGFGQEEIDGAVYLEQERVRKKITTTTQSDVTGLRNWQGIGETDSQNRTFQALFERLSALASLDRLDPEQGKLARKFLEHYARETPQDLQGQLFQLILANKLGIDAPVVDPVVRNIFNNLGKKEQIEGRDVSSLEALTSADLSFEAKTQWWSNRFMPRLEFLNNRQSMLQQAVEQEKPSSIDSGVQQNKPGEQTQPSAPPEAKDEYEQHRGREEKGKGQPTFIVDPYYGGYWEEDCFSRIDEKTGRLFKSGTQAVKTATTPQAGIIEGSRRRILGQSGTNLFSLPLASGFYPTKEGISALRQKGLNIFSDSEGHVFIRSATNQSYEIEIAKLANPSTSKITIRDSEFTQALPPEISVELARIDSLNIDSLSKAREWRNFVHNFFKYPKDDEVAPLYSQVDSGVRIDTMVKLKLLDCYLAREFFLAGLKRINLPNLEWWAVNGHFVKGKQKDGTAHLHSGTAHAWAKLRLTGQSSWTIFDPTPKGDPLTEGDNGTEEFDDSGSQPLSNTDLEQLENEANESKPTGEKTETPPVDEYLLQFAQEAGIDLGKAQKILDQLKEVDQLQDSQGRNISARMGEQFSRIVQSYTKEREEKIGLVKMSEGEELEDPVAARLDVVGGSLDPTGFLRREVVPEQQEYYGWFDIEVIGDGSGSMKDPLVEGGIKKYLMQQKMCYLIHRRAHYFAQEAQRRKLRLITPFKIRSSQYIFRGNNIEPVMPLSEEFTPANMVQLWDRLEANVGGETPAHLGLKTVYDNITPEEAELLKNKKLLKVVVLVSDGGYDNASEVDRIKRQLEEMNVVVAQFIITDSKSLEDLPEQVAEKVIEASRALIPQKVKKK